MSSFHIEDVICGMTIDPATAAGRSVFRGRTYHFCSKGCQVSFDAEPARYAPIAWGALDLPLGRDYRLIASPNGRL